MTLRVVESSVVIERARSALAAVARLLQPLVRRLDRLPTHPDAPIDVAQITPAITGSRLGRALSAVLRLVFAAAADARMVQTATVAVDGRDASGTVARGALTVMVGATVHLILLVFFEPYPFPSRAATILPGVVFVLAAAVLLSHRSVAAALRDRRDRA